MGPPKLYTTPLGQARVAQSINYYCSWRLSNKVTGQINHGFASCLPSLSLRQNGTTRDFLPTSATWWQGIFPTCPGAWCIKKPILLYTSRSVRTGEKQIIHQETPNFIHQSPAFPPDRSRKNPCTWCTVCEEFASRHYALMPYTVV